MSRKRHQHPRQDRLSAIHEAGHLAANQALVFGFHEAVLWPGPGSTDSRGRPIIGPTTHGSSFNCHIPVPVISGYPEQSHALIREEARRYIITCLAGPIAEARYAKCSLVAVLVAGGRDDFKQIQAVLKFLDLPDEERCALELESERSARQLLSEHWSAVTAIADAMLAGEKADSDHAALAGIACEPFPAHMMAARQQALATTGG
jgi:hypothetical protein